MTRSTISLFKGNILDSFFYNPLAIVVNIMVLGAFVWMIVDLAQNKVRFETFIRRKIHPAFLIAIFLIVFANWFWNIRKGY